MPMVGVIWLEEDLHELGPKFPLLGDRIDDPLRCRPQLLWRARTPVLHGHDRHETPVLRCGYPCDASASSIPFARQTEKCMAGCAYP